MNFTSAKPYRNRIQRHDLETPETRSAPFPPRGVSTRSEGLAHPFCIAIDHVAELPALRREQSVGF